MANITVKERENIQVLRALSCLLVIFQHITVFSALSVNKNFEPYLPINYGFIGVLVFFVISGFVMTKCMMEGPGFIWNRFKRIYPAYWGAIIISYVFIKAVSSEPWVISWQAFLLLPTKDLINTLHIPYWTLIYEIIFYAIIYAFILLRVTKYLSSLCVIWLALICIMDIYHPVNVFIPGSLIIFSPLNMFFIAGILLFQRREKPLFSAVETPYLAMLSLGLAISAKYVTTDHASVTYFIGAMSTIALFETAMRMSFPQLLVKLGNFSYGMYLIHWILIEVTLNTIKHFIPETKFILTWLITWVFVLPLSVAYGYAEYCFHNKAIKAYRFKNG